MKNFRMVAILCSTMAIVGCGSQASPNTQQGEFVINVQWPDSEQAGFKIKAIPAQTTVIAVVITDEDTQEVIKKEIKRGDQTQERLFLKLKTGKKSIQARAFDASQSLLAEDFTRVLIEGGKKSTAILELKAVDAVKDTDSIISKATSPEATAQNDTPEKLPVEKLSEAKKVKAATKKVVNSLQKNADALSRKQQLQLKKKAVKLSSGLGLPIPNHNGGGNSGTRILRGGAAPIIHSLSANPGIVSGVLYPTEITVEVTDDNPLVASDFHWSCGGGLGDGCGTFTNNKGRKIIWRAPATGGIYIIKVRINDGVNSVSKQMSILVKEGTANATFQGGIN